MLALVQAGLGVAFVPDAARQLHFDGIVLKRIVSPVPPPVELYAAWREDNDNPTLAQALRILPGPSATRLKKA